MRKYGVTIGCSACSVIAVHGKVLKPHTEKCRQRIGQQMEHDPEGHERLQVHKRRRDVETEVEVHRTPVAKEKKRSCTSGKQDVEMPVGTPVGSASVKRGRMLQLTMKKVLACDSELKTKKTRNTMCKACLIPRNGRSQAGTQERSEA